MENAKERLAQADLILAVFDTTRPLDDDDRRMLQRQWAETSYQIQRLRDNADCAEQDNFELPADLDVQAHQQRVSEIEPAARALHDYWLSRR